MSVGHPRVSLVQTPQYGHGIEWLNGIGLVCNMAGVLLIYLYGVPNYSSRADAGKAHLLLGGGENADPAERTRVQRAVWKSRAGLAVLAVGFALQLAAVIRY